MKYLSPIVSFVSSGWAVRLLLVAGALPVATGCHSYHWRQDYVQAETQARQEGKHLFIFYKWWLDSNSNRMLSETLADSKVKAQFKDTINVQLDRDFSEFGHYVRKYGVRRFPASIIVAPDSTYQVRIGFIPRDQFLAFVKWAKSPRTERIHPRPPAGRAP
jgi:hypothetical protein